MNESNLGLPNPMSSGSCPSLWHHLVFLSLPPSLTFSSLAGLSLVSELFMSIPTSEFLQSLWLRSLSLDFPWFSPCHLDLCLTATSFEKLVLSVQSMLPPCLSAPHLPIPVLWKSYHLWLFDNLLLSSLPLSFFSFLSVIIYWPSLSAKMQASW